MADIPLAGAGAPNIAVPGLGVVWHGNLLDGPPPGDQPVVCWSGWAGDQPRAMDRVWSASFETWGPAGIASRDEAIGELAASRREVLIRPHARHALSDTPGVATVARDQGGSRLGVLLEPAALFTPEMLRDADEHIERMAQLLVPLAAAILLSDVSSADDELRLVAAGEGELRDALGPIQSSAEQVGIPIHRAVEAG
ncbi:MAG: hypothetical protein AAGB51_00250 [Planctomycetota bacterium]